MERVVNSYKDRLEKEQLRNTDDFTTYRAKVDYENALKELCRLRWQKCQLDLWGVADQEVMPL